jgi:hypothetical protein
MAQRTSYEAADVRNGGENVREAGGKCKAETRLGDQYRQVSEARDTWRDLRELSERDADGPCAVCPGAPVDQDGALVCAFDNRGLPR